MRKDERGNFQFYTRTMIRGTFAYKRGLIVFDSIIEVIEYFNSYASLIISCIILMLFSVDIDKDITNLDLRC